jgi:hypothetical protein
MIQVVPADCLSTVRDQHFGAGDGEAFSRFENEGTIIRFVREVMEVSQDKEFARLAPVIGWR